jgi:cold shock protein
MNIRTVKWFSLEKGYGFIHPDDGRSNIFVRLSTVERAGLSGLKEGQRIIFEIEQDERGPTAVSLQL